MQIVSIGMRYTYSCASAITLDIKALEVHRLICKYKIANMI